jgi:hypothetical protein
MIAVVGRGVFKDLPNALRAQTQEEIIHWEHYDEVDLSQKLDGAVVADLVIGPRSDFAWTSRHLITQLRENNSDATIVAIVSMGEREPHDYIQAGATQVLSYDSMNALTPLVRLLKP